MSTNKTDLEQEPSLELNFISSLFIIKREKLSISLTSSLVFREVGDVKQTHYKTPTHIPPPASLSTSSRTCCPKMKAELSFRNITWSVECEMRPPETPAKTGHVTSVLLIPCPSSSGVDHSTINWCGPFALHLSLLCPGCPANLRDSEVDTRSHSFFRWS